MKFSKPVGATANLRELEYISALHQTSKSLRRDGSIKPTDITKFLMSRYGIKVTDTEVSQTIAKGFGGGGLSEEDGNTLDLTEIVALLLIPELVKAEMSLHRDYLEREMIKTGHNVIVTDSNDNNNGGIFNNVNTNRNGNDNDIFYEDDNDTKRKLNLHEKKMGSEDVWSSTNYNENRVSGIRGESRWPDSDLIPQVLCELLCVFIWYAFLSYKLVTF